MAEGTAHFAWQLMCDGFRGWVIPFEVVVAVGEVDVVLVEDGGPLEGCSCGTSVPRFDSMRSRLTVLGLACRAMAQLAV
jgi:hypothetical protein